MRTGADPLQRCPRWTTPPGVILIVLLVTGAVLVAPTPASAGPFYDACIQAGLQSPEGPHLNLQQLCSDVEETINRGSVVTRWFQSLPRQGQDYYLLRTEDCNAERALLASLERAIIDTEIFRANMEQFLAYRASATTGDSRLGQFLGAQHRNFAVLSRNLRDSRPEDRCRQAVLERPDPPPPPPDVPPQQMGQDVLRYAPPLVDGRPVAALPSGGGNSKQAADAFCQSQGYSESVGHSSNSHSTTPTWHPDSRRQCNRGSACGLLRQVDCHRRAGHIPAPR